MSDFRLPCNLQTNLFPPSLSSPGNLTAPTTTSVLRRTAPGIFFASGSILVYPRYIPLPGTTLSSS